MCQCDINTNHISFKTDISTQTPTDLPAAGTAMFITPGVGGGQNYETYWVGSNNIFPVMRESLSKPTLL